jgi:hypothetical protein
VEMFVHVHDAVNKAVFRGDGLQIVSGAQRPKHPIDVSQASELSLYSIVQLLFSRFSVPPPAHFPFTSLRHDGVAAGLCEYAEVLRGFFA